MSASQCIHLNGIEDHYREYVLKNKSRTCESCDEPGPNLWLCLTRNCGYVGCGERSVDHSTQHFQSKSDHSLTANVNTLRVWCYKCEGEVYPDNNISPLESNNMSDITPLVGRQVTQPTIHQTQRISGSNIDYARSCEDTDEEMEDSMEGERHIQKPCGLTGLQNIGNTCYMNAALQALSNCPPLTQYFLTCGAFIRSDQKPGLSKSYFKLMTEMWHKKRPSYVVPSMIAYGIKMVCPLFRGYTQQDSQEFLRCFMDQLHEELKQASIEAELSAQPAVTVEMFSEIGRESEDSSQSEAEYETCDSGLSSERSSYSDEMGDSGDVINNVQSPSSAHSRKKAKGRGIGGCRDPSSVNALKERDLPHSGGEGNSVELADVIPELTMSSPQVTDRSQSPAYSTPRSHAHQSPPKGGSAPSSSPTPLYLSSSPPNNTPYLMSKPSRRKKPPKYRSIVSEVFDGKILSTVQCLTCDRVSSTRETFQDLSLPIPTRDYLAMLRASQAVGHKGALTVCADSQQTWFNWMFSFVRRIVDYPLHWFWGPTVSLQDCLSAFFSADELKGDNMYSCDKCKKLRNGIKYCKVMELPEMLCIHLKRFRHELMFSSKINSYVTFPLEGLDMKPFLHKDSQSKVVTYNLAAVICHHGTAGGGHYTAYALNAFNELWYEFDDQFVTQVEPQAVANCEAYVLFYRKNCDEMNEKRLRVLELIKMSEKENDLIHFYISKQWLNKFNTFAEPGPIVNSDFLCPHGGVHPNKASYFKDMCVRFPQGVWEYLHGTFGGGPACSNLFMCPVCQQEQEQLEARQRHEMETFIRLHQEFQEVEFPKIVYAISMHWFRQWENFVKGKECEPPGPIDNISIYCTKNGQIVPKMGSDIAQLSEDMWRFLHNIYGGGPELVLQQNAGGATCEPVPHQRAGPAGDRSTNMADDSVPMDTSSPPDV